MNRNSQKKSSKINVSKQICLRTGNDLATFDTYSENKIS